MINKAYEKVKEFIKENYKILLVYIILFIVLTYRLPYYIYVGGGTIDVNKRIEVVNETISKGSFNLAYVSEIKATIPTLLLSKVFKSWDVVKIDDLTLSDNEDEKDVLVRDRLYLNDANQNAIKVAYEKAFKTFKITNVDLVVAYIIEDAKTDMKIGDIITEIGGQKITNFDDLTKFIKEYDIDENIEFTVKRSDKIVKCYAVLQKINDSNVIGISFLQNFKYETDPKISFKFKKDESGPSGGLMTAISIYDKLVEEDITNGLKIVGTGTINSDGTVGAIGGVKYKLQGAVKAKADVFVVPNGENYDEVMAIMKKEKYKIKIIGVSTFDDAIKELNKLKK